jgi:hypothetical protein
MSGIHAWVILPTQHPPAARTLLRTVFVPETNCVYSYGGLVVHSPYDMEVLSEFTHVFLDKDQSWSDLASVGPLVNSVLVASYPYIYAYGGCSELVFTGILVKCVNASSELMKYDISKNEWTIQDTHVIRIESRGIITANNVLYIYGGKNLENKPVGDLMYLGKCILYLANL